MKFQLKALAAALVLVATLPAHAAFSNSASGNGSMMLTVLDTSNSISAIFDLGKNYSDFSSATLSSFADSGVTNSGTNFSWDLTSASFAPAWNSFLAVANLANTKWAVTGGDTLGSGAGQNGYIATYASAGTALANNPMTQGAAAFDAYTQEALFGGNVATGGAGYAGFAIYKTGQLNAKGANVVGAINNDLGVIQYTTAAGNGLAVANKLVFGNSAKFNLSSAGQLIYSTNAPVPSVPEADTWAMMLLGLGFMGFVARRRKV